MKFKTFAMGLLLLGVCSGLVLGQHSFQFTPRVPQNDFEIEDGLLISRVLPDSPAEAAGLLRGDILLKIEGTEVNSIAAVRELLSEYRAGSRVSLTITRGGSEKTVGLKLEDRLYRPPVGVEFASSGFPMIDFSAQFDGVLVIDVEPGSPAEKAGLERRDIIVSIDGETVMPDELRPAIQNHKANDRITLEVVRRESESPVELDVTLGETPNGDAYLGAVKKQLPGFS